MSSARRTIPRCKVCSERLMNVIRCSEDGILSHEGVTWETQLLFDAYAAEQLLVLLHSAHILKLRNAFGLLASPVSALATMQQAPQACYVLSNRVTLQRRDAKCSEELSSLTEGGALQGG